MHPSTSWERGCASVYPLLALHLNTVYGSTVGPLGGATRARHPIFVPVLENAVELAVRLWQCALVCPTYFFTCLAPDNFTCHWGCSAT